MNPGIRRTATVAAALLALAASATAGEAPRAAVGTAVRVAGPAAGGDDTDPAVAYNAVQDEYLVVWTDARSRHTTVVYGQRIAPDGSRIGPNLRISGTSAGDVAFPDVAVNADTGLYLVVWMDSRNSPTRGWDVYGQRLSWSGVRLGPNFRISGGAATGDEREPTAAYNPASGRFLVAWQDGRAGPDEIWGQRVAANGAPVGANLRVSGAGAARVAHPAAACRATAAQCLVVWEDRRSGFDVYGQRIGMTGTRLGADLRISTGPAAYQDRRPDAAHDPAYDRYLVVWQTDRDVARRGWDVYARRVSPAGALPAPPVRVVGPSATGQDLDPAVSARPGGGYRAVWDDTRNVATRREDVYGGRLDAAGRRVGADFLIGGALAADLRPDVACRPGRCFAAWEDYRAVVTRGSDIWGRRAD